MLKFINWLTKTAEDLKDFDEKVQSEIQKYSNKQVRKVAIVCSAVFFILGFIVRNLM